MIGRADFCGAEINVIGKLSQFIPTVSWIWTQFHDMSIQEY